MCIINLLLKVGIYTTSFSYPISSSPPLPPTAHQCDTHSIFHIRARWLRVLYVLEYYIASPIVEKSTISLTLLLLPIQCSKAEGSLFKATRGTEPATRRRLNIRITVALPIRRVPASIAGAHTSYNFWIVVHAVSYECCSSACETNIYHGRLHVVQRTG